LYTVGLFILLFGVGYLWSAVTGQGERLFIAIAAAGKLGFVTLVTTLWLDGELPARAPLAASPDLIFGALFAVWLFGARPAVEVEPSAQRAWR
jgi:hypothetical protein